MQSPYVYQKLYLRDLHFIHETEEFVNTSREPIDRVDIIGTVVYLSTREKVVIFELDDLTGIIECTQFKVSCFTGLNGESGPATEDETAHSLSSSHLISSLVAPQVPLQLGDLVNIRGHANFFRNKPQIVCRYIRKVSDPNEIWFRMKEIEDYKSYLSSRKPRTKSH